MAVGIILASYAVLPIFVAIAIGRWVDRTGTRIPLRIATTGLGMGLLLPWLFPSIWALGVCAAMVGLFMAIIYIAMQHSAGALSDASTRMRIFSQLSVAQSAASLIGPPLTGVLIDTFGHGAAFLGMGVIALGLLATVVAFSGLLPHGNRHQDEKPRNLRDLLRLRRVRHALFISSLAPVGWELLLFFVPLHGARLGLSASAIGLIVTSFALSVVAVRLAVPWLSRHSSEWGLIAGAMGAAGLMFLLFPFTRSAADMMMLAVVFGFAAGISQPLTVSIVYVASPPGRQAEVIGMRTTALNLMQTAAPLSLGLLSASIGLAAAVWPLSLLLMGGAWFAWARRSEGEATGR
jgi:predicted MFS family arabinose efflux permease